MAYFGKKNKNMLYSFLAGTAVGTGLTLLTAPKSGKELRGQISDMADESFTKIKDYTSTAQSKISEGFETGKRAINDKRTMVSSAIQKGKEAIAEERERQRGELREHEGSSI